MSAPRFSSRAASRGFTLVELTVALLAGLIVAIGVMALSREATTTFHQEVRSAAAESGARAALDRLRADLQRASFMSSPNIVADSMIAHAPGAGNIDNIPTARAGLRRLAGVRLFVGGSKATTPLSNVASNGLNPDAIELGGNFTTTDEYVVSFPDAPTGGCQRLWLQLDSPAIYRLGTASPGIVLRNAFQPVSASATTRFIVRMTDDSGHFTYVSTCPKADAAGFSNNKPYVDIEDNGSGGSSVLTANQTQTVGGGSAYLTGMRINPVQIVRWQITNAPGTQAVSGLNAIGDTTKYDLVRSFVDADGAVVAETTEVVAEYAIDLKFAFTVDGGDNLGQTPVHTTLAFDDVTNGTWAYDVSTQAASSIGPQRIRSVRVRLVTRTAVADRLVSATPTPANPSGQKFLYRYCVDTDNSKCTAGDRMVWARARTLTTEVFLRNQARSFE